MVTLNTKEVGTSNPTASTPENGMPPLDISKDESGGEQSPTKEEQENSSISTPAIMLKRPLHKEEQWDLMNQTNREDSTLTTLNHPNQTYKSIEEKGAEDTHTDANQQMEEDCHQQVEEDHHQQAEEDHHQQAEEDHHQQAEEDHHQQAEGHHPTDQFNRRTNS
ncbi:hypothetical protein EI94DRAFT_1813731 [Lactarius quietus]|nr:hypothetical protein EI94DRAFT_1813731 [Lactarius quietus]